MGLNRLNQNFLEKKGVDPAQPKNISKKIDKMTGSSLGVKVRVARLTSTRGI